MATNPANQYGTKELTNRYPPNSLTSLNDNDWALYAGVEFGNSDYPKQADSISIFASCNSSGGIIEVILDSLSGIKIAELQIGDTEGWDNYETFTTNITSEISGCHDVYLKYTGSDTEELFRLQTITFTENDEAPTSVGGINKNQVPNNFILEQNYPNPFNPVTTIKFTIPNVVDANFASTTLKIYDILSQEITTLVNEKIGSGEHEISFDASALSSGVYFYQLRIGNLVQSKKMLVLR
ncbi:MAG: hypothetical protein A2068_02120 [Ignavibacteria bacterium GWB2_35_6b]|nr:MAG: hypothetical protein A2068_02120 [Ignavibacteria bacterium GWB2_35_6b]